MCGHLQELESQFSFGKDVHAPQVADDLETGRKLDAAAQLLQELVEHELAARFHVVDDLLQTQ